MSNCTPKVLLEGTRYSISRCTCCNRIGMFYNNLLVGFYLSDFLTFAQKVAATDFNKRSVLFPDRYRYLIVKTCDPDIQFAFRSEEFEEFVDILNQARLLLEATFQVEKS